MADVLHAYCDGGVIGPNPSRMGVTWAYCWVGAGDVRLSAASGVVEPADFGMEKLTNNHSELYAAVRCLEALGPDWRGTLHTDSLVTLNRLVRRQPGFENCPQWLINRTLAVRRHRKWDVLLVAGHPTKDEIRTGFARRNGLPVSQWNVLCDKLCTAAAGRFKVGIAGGSGVGGKATVWYDGRR